MGFVLILNGNEPRAHLLIIFKGNWFCSYLKGNWPPEYPLTFTEMFPKIFKSGSLFVIPVNYRNNKQGTRFNYFWKWAGQGARTFNVRSYPCISSNK